MARARALMVLVAAAFRSELAHASATRVATFSVGRALPPRAGARAAVSLPPPTHALRPGASSGARAVPPRNHYRTPGSDSHVEASTGLPALSRRGRIAVLAAYTSAAVYAYLDLPDVESDDENSFALPSCCYPSDPLLSDEVPVAMFGRRQRLPTRKDVQDMKLLLFLILRELRRPKQEDWFTLLKPLVLEFLLDPSTYILFPYLTASAFLERLFCNHFSQFECPFSGLIELPSSSCFDSISESDSNGCNSGDNGVISWPVIVWGKNMWPDITENLSLSNNGSIKMSINEAALDLGLKCLRYEIRDISPPVGVKKSMEMQAEAERRNMSQILEAEGAMLDQANRAKGEAEAILARSQATVEGIRMVSRSMSAEGRTEAANLRVTEQYIKAFSALAKNTITTILPSHAGNPLAMMAQSLNKFKHIFNSSGQKGGSLQAEEAEEADQPSVTSGMLPLVGVKKAMEMQAEAERIKRAQILESEGAMLDRANRAKCEAEAILARSQATAEGIGMVSEPMSAEGSIEAVNLRVAEQYIKAFSALSKNTTTMILPSDAGNPSAMIAQSLNIYKHIFKSGSPKGGSPQAGEAEEANQPSVTSGMPLLGAI